MRIPGPRSLLGQTVAVLLAGIVVSHLLTTLVFSLDRLDREKEGELFDAARRSVTVLKLLARAPADLHRQILKATNSQISRVSMAPTPLVAAGPPRDDLEREILDYLGERGATVTDLLEIRVRIEGNGRHDALLALPERIWNVLTDNPAGRINIRVSYGLPGGSWLNFEGRTVATPPLLPATLIALLVSIVVFVGALSVWLVAKAVRPLRRFAGAAEALGRDIHAPAIPEEGTREVRTAIRAFNAMQDRIGALLDNRTRMLAAISHDLRTPITTLRLRAESLEPGETRTRMLATLDEMERMIATVLDFIRDSAENETPRQVDLRAFADAVVDDYRDLGRDVILADAPETFPATCRPDALRRALTNLIDNALKFAGSAVVTLVREGDEAVLRIEDEGPGIPEALHETVFLPFMRGDPARTADGNGLGLSIAQSVANAHGGTVTLANRTPHGLWVEIRFPV